MYINRTVYVSDLSCQLHLDHSIACIAVFFSCCQACLFNHMSAVLLIVQRWFLKEAVCMFSCVLEPHVDPKVLDRNCSICYSSLKLTTGKHQILENLRQDNHLIQITHTILHLTLEDIGTTHSC